ncbi:MAG: DivIVA domain-containing protein [Oscillospiraceae bacterium]|nr:DivIVA domain-containing protein [Oscillospiraceae bacterium]
MWDYAYELREFKRFGKRYLCFSANVRRRGGATPFKFKTLCVLNLNDYNIERTIVMGAKEIMSKKFETVLRGYKAEEVDEFLREISLDFSRLQKENEDLEKKLEVLADKIREYREDEDALKDALLGAQRQGNALIADSKRKAAVIVEDAQKESDEIIKKAEEERVKLKEKIDKDIAAADEKAKKIVEKANANARDVEDETNRKIDIQKEILHRMTIEIEEFKRRVLSSYAKHTGDIEKISEECENDFIKETRREYGETGGSPYLKEKGGNSPKEERENRNANSEAAEFAEVGESVENAEPAEETINMEYTTDLPDAVVNGAAISENTVNFEINVNERYANDETIEMNLNSIFGKDDMENYDSDIEEFPLFKEKDAQKTNEIFFKKSRGSGRSKQLRFGNNNEE